MSSGRSVRAYEAIGFREAWRRLRDPAANDRIAGIDCLVRPDQTRDAGSRELYALHGLAPDVANFSGFLTFTDRFADRHLETQEPCPRGARDVAFGRDNLVPADLGIAVDHL